MRKIALAFAAIAAMSGVCRAVTFDVVHNVPPEWDLSSLTIRATGIGINVLGKFTISGIVNHTGGLWTGDGSAGGPTDSCVLFGDLRLPDVAGYTWDPRRAQDPRRLRPRDIAR